MHKTTLPLLSKYYPIDTHESFRMVRSSRLDNPIFALQGVPGTGTNLIGFQSQ
jgi:hypothetical protein